MQYSKNFKFCCLFYLVCTVDVPQIMSKRSFSVIEGGLFVHLRSAGVKIQIVLETQHLKLGVDS